MLQIQGVKGKAAVNLLRTLDNAEDGVSSHIKLQQYIDH
jgi:hypothetical protein